MRSLGQKISWNCLHDQCFYESEKLIKCQDALLEDLQGVITKQEIINEVCLSFLSSHGFEAD